MLIFFQEIIFLTIIWILRMIEGIMEVFNILINFNISINTESKEPIQFLLTDSKIMVLFYTIFIITIFLCFVFTIYSIIKNVIKNNKSISQIVGASIISIISTMIVLMIILIIISINNIILNLLFEVLDINTNINISKLIFNNSVGNYLFDFSINEITFNTNNPNIIIGEYIINEGYIFPSEWKLNGMINPNNFLFLPSLITSILVLISLINVVINIIKRIYKIVLLYVMLPISLSTLPVDNGNSFNIWKEELIKEIIIIYGIILSVNLLYIILPILLNVFINTNISNYGKNIIQLFIISSGALFISSSIKIFKNIFSKSKQVVKTI